MFCCLLINACLVSVTEGKGRSRSLQVLEAPYFPSAVFRICCGYDSFWVGIPVLKGSPFK